MLTVVLKLACFPARIAVLYEPMPGYSGRPKGKLGWKHAREFAVKVHYLEIVSSDVGAACAAYEAAHVSSLDQLIRFLEVRGRLR